MKQDGTLSFMMDLPLLLSLLPVFLASVFVTMFVLQPALKPLPEKIALEAAKRRIAQLEQQKELEKKKRATRRAELEVIVHPEDLPTSYDCWPFTEPTKEQLDVWAKDPVAAEYAKNVVKLVLMVEEDIQSELIAQRKTADVEVIHGVSYTHDLDLCPLHITMCEDIWREYEHKHRMAPIGTKIHVLATPFRKDSSHGAIYWLHREDTPIRWKRVKYLY